MTFDPERHHRRSIRLRGYDYSLSGAYFVTVCVQGRAQLLGDIWDGRMVPSEAGRMVEDVWTQLASRFPCVELDAFTLMPNHVHGIVLIDRSTVPLGDVVGAFKSVTTHEYVVGVKGPGWPAFERRLWQRNYYEHVVRDEDELNRIRDYILVNPMRWELDRENPVALKGQGADEPWQV